MTREADAATLESLRLADSALPVGTDSVSYGLEQFVAADRVTDADDLAALLETLLRQQLGRADLVALRAATRDVDAHGGDAAGVDATAPDSSADGGGTDADDSTLPPALAPVLAADRRLVALTLPAEFRESATRTGARLARLQRDLRADPLVDAYARAVETGEAPGAYPVVLGLVSARAGVDPRQACLVACHEFTTAAAGAAQRLLSLGHTDVQRVVDGCRPAMLDAVAESAGRSLDDMTAFTPLVDVLAADHERADRRLFVS